MQRLPNQLKALLSEILSKYHPEWADQLQTEADPLLDENQRFELRLSCTSELCATGLTDNDEPNERGYRIEELIDWLGGEMNGTVTAK